MVQRKECLAAAAIFFLTAPAAAVPVLPGQPAIPPARPEPLIRVLLGSFERFVVEGRDLELNGETSLAGNAVFHLRCVSEPNGAGIVELGGGHRFLGRLEIRPPDGFLRLNERSYRRKLTVIAGDGRCLVVNSLELEHYLAGVVSREMSPSWPLEALKAQAVASRSYALHQMAGAQLKDWDVDSTTQDQVYEGADSESPRGIQAVIATRRLVLGEGTRPLKAYFHANCGGRTELPGHVWGGDSRSFRSVACPYHRRSRDRASWSLRISREQLEQALRRLAALPRGFLRLASLAMGSSPLSSHRLSGLSVRDTRGLEVTVPATQLRNALGTTRVRSTAFVVRPEPAGFRIEGEGFGHGVGLCQVGARAMAEEGKGFREILRFYYPLAKTLSIQ